MRALQAARFCSRQNGFQASVARALNLRDLDPRLQKVLQVVLEKPDRVDDILNIPSPSSHVDGHPSDHHVAPPAAPHRPSPTRVVPLRSGSDHHVAHAACARSNALSSSSPSPSDSTLSLLSADGKASSSDSVPLPPPRDREVNGSEPKKRGKEKVEEKKAAADNTVTPPSSSRHLPSIPAHRPMFAEHWSDERVAYALKKQEAFEGVLRVSAFHTDRAFVERGGRDTKKTMVRVKGFIGRNRAMNGDHVIARWNTTKETEGEGEGKEEDGEENTSNSSPKLTEAQENLIEMAKKILRNSGGKMKMTDLGSHDEMVKARVKRRGGLVSTLELCPEIEIEKDEEGRPMFAVLEPSEEDLALSSSGAPSSRPTIEQGACWIVNVSQRAHTRIVGTLKKGENMVQPRDVRLPAIRIDESEAKVLISSYLSKKKKDDADADAHCPPKNRHDRESTTAGENTAPMSVVVNYRQWPATEFTPQGSITEVLGRHGEPLTECNSIAAFYNFTTLDHTKEMEREAMIEREDEMKRRDLRNLRIFTVDPPQARDLDDALSVEVLPGGRVRVGVHIADVTHYVKPGSLIDEEAKKRSVTLYLVNKVYPMLPRVLSNNLCSLIPHVDRYAFSVFYIINPDGTVSKKGREFTKSIIHSSKRWSYKEVDDALRELERDRQERGSKSRGVRNVDPIVADLDVLRTITKARKGARLSTGGVALSGKADLQFELDEEGNPIGLYYAPKEGESPSHTLIEELMVLCNHVVAKKLLEKQGGLLRSHRESDRGPETILSILGDDVPPKEVPRTTRALLDWVEVNKPEAYEAICFSALQNKAFKPAEYEMLEKGKRHWTLNLPSYLHFTSPIRRYADIVVHRLLLDQLLDRPSQILTLSEIAQKCNSAKREAFDASLDSVRWNLGEYLRLYRPDGLKTDVVITKLIENENDENLKPAVELYVPMVAQVKSLSLEHLNLTVEEARSLPVLVPVDAVIGSVTDQSRNWTVWSIHKH